MKTKLTLAATAVVAAFSAPTFADHDIETITITGHKSKQALSTEIATGNTINPDAASWLEVVPGAGVNRNGQLSGIAQYRGLYGDRVSVKMSGQHLVGAGPNAMDTPLSYATPIMIDSMTVYRGIAPVHAGTDTLGGAIDVQLQQAQFSGRSNQVVSGNVQAGFNQQGDAKSYAGVVNVAAKDYGVLAYFSQHEGDNVEDGAGRVIPSTFFDKLQYGTDLRVKTTRGKVGLSYAKTETDNSGTAALPMDIEYIDADRVTLSGQQQFNDWQLDWSIGYLDAVHGMDNHTMRANSKPMMYRLNTADVEATDFKFQALTTTALGELMIGLDGYVAKHNSIITSAANPMFNVKNFYDVKDDKLSLYTHLDTKLNTGQLGLGLRVKYNGADAGDVSHHMAMMNPNIKALQMAFNQADKSQSEVNFDLVANWTMAIAQHSQVLIGAAVKQKAPSYQERYLWLPMQATAGLADGRTYIGNIVLESETAYQLNAGISIEEANFAIAPNLFYQKIDDYIQGTVSTNMPANMVSNMMTGMMPLQFNNLDAELYGIDMTARYNASRDLIFTGVASYVRGERTDINDDLYRISAPNVKLNASYYGADWQANLAWQVFAKQDKVAKLNNEQSSAGYGLVNASAIYYLGGLSVEIGVNNLFDKQYADHIAGTNRVMMAEVARGQKLPGTGRDLYLKLDYQF